MPCASSITSRGDFPALAASSSKKQRPSSSSSTAFDPEASRSEPNRRDSVSTTSLRVSSGLLT